MIVITVERAHPLVSLMYNAGRCVLCIAHLLLKFLATGGLAVPLPDLDWPWYPHENTGAKSAAD